MVSGSDNANHPDFSGTMFIEPTGVNNSALLFLTLIYAVILYQSSNLISSGSELLLLVPAMASLVGSIVLPILGAVPDGMMTLCSGLGPDAQNEVGTGVGVLAGSTVMLLTFPWFLAVLAGRVPLDSSGQANYKQKNKGGGSGLFDSGVSFENDIVTNGKMMLATTLIYLVIQIPASMAESHKSAGVDDAEEATREASAEHLPALVGLILSALGFVLYLFACYKQSQQDAGGAGNGKVIDRVIEGIKAGEVSLSAALQFCADDSAAGMAEPLVEGNGNKMVEKIVKPFFRKYDTDNSKTLEVSEFKILLSDLGEYCSPEEVTNAFKRFDTTKDGKLDLGEVTKALSFYMNDPGSRAKIKAQVLKEKAKGAKTLATYKEKPSEGDEEEEGGEEEEEMPEDLRQLSPEEQQSRVKRRACWMMALGTFIVLFVSDPFVDVLNVWGDRLGIPAFYVSFVVAPFASNASELLSAYVYAAKKTKSSITTALSTLIGAACMNNTFVLFIFFGLIYFKNLAWQFTAETLAIMVVQWIIGLLAIFKKTHSLFFGFVILACFPLCLCIVAGLEAYGWD